MSRLIGKPILDAAAWLYYQLKARAYTRFEGRFYAYKGRPIDIVEDDDYSRWLLHADIKRIVPDLPRYGVINRIYPEGSRIDAVSSQEYIESEALIRLLSKAQDQSTIRFVRWVQREVAFPSQRRFASRP